VDEYSLSEKTLELQKWREANLIEKIECERLEKELFSEKINYSEDINKCRLLMRNQKNELEILKHKSMILE
jgi:hypothetical protein